jgi:hypothetical protein
MPESQGGSAQRSSLRVQLEESPGSRQARTVAVITKPTAWLVQHRRDELLGQPLDELALSLAKTGQPAEESIQLGGPARLGP